MIYVYRAWVLRGHPAGGGSSVTVETVFQDGYSRAYDNKQRREKTKEKKSYKKGIEKLEQEMEKLRIKLKTPKKRGR